MKTQGSSSGRFLFLGRLCQVSSCLILAAMLLFSATQAARDRKASTTDFSLVRNAVSQAFLDQLSSSRGVSEADQTMLRRLYGLEEGSLESFLLYAPDSMGAQEMLLVKASPAADMEEVQHALQSRREAQLTKFEGYGPSQTALLEKAQICVRGRYALYVCCEDPAAVVNTFESALS